LELLKVIQLKLHHINYSLQLVQTTSHFCKIYIQVLIVLIVHLRLMGVFPKVVKNFKHSITYFQHPLDNIVCRLGHHSHGTFMEVLTSGHLTLTNTQQPGTFQDQNHLN
jgi:hypothetical protein